MSKEQSHIAYKDRVLIEGLSRDGVNLRGIGILLNRHRNSISLEYNRNGMTKKTYRALQAQLLIR